MSGLTSTGFVPKSLDDCKTDLETAFKTAFGSAIDLSAESPYSQVIGVMAERFAELWALAAAVYAAGTPDGAAGAQLDNLCAITGTLRSQATFTKATVTALGTNGTVLTAGRVVSVATVGTRFATLANATIATVPAWQATHTYAVGNRVTNVGNVYQVISVTSDAHSAGAGGPTGTGSSIADNHVTWEYVGAGTACVDVAVQAAVTGPLVAPAGTLTVISTPVSGWNSVTNLLDASPIGTDLELDDDLRLKRENELRVSGAAALEAIREALLEVSQVTAATVFENVSDSTDGNGVPPHAIEALVQGGADADVRACLFAETAAGIAMHGSTTGTVTDAQGVSHEVDFSRPTLINIYVIVNCSVDANLYPADGDAEVKAAIVAFGNAQKTGKDVVSTGVGAQCFSVPGMLDSVPLIGTAPSPGSTATIAISSRQLAAFDTSRIIVNSTPVTP